MRNLLCALTAILAAVILLSLPGVRWDQTATAATVQQPGLRWERELGRQKLTPTSSTALTMPIGTKHAEFYVEGGSCLVTWNGGAPVDSATGAMKWPEGHFRKEASDGPKLSGFRAKCADCTLWVDYFGDRAP